MVEEESLVLGSILRCESSAGNDFEGPFAKSLGPKNAVLTTFCIDDDRTTTVTAKWILIAWIPDGTKVRDKMLYSSSREDLRKTLGLGYFVSEFYANTIEDMTWSQLNEYMNTGKLDAVFSQTEINIQKEKVCYYSNLLVLVLFILLWCLIYLSLCRH